VIELLPPKLQVNERTSEHGQLLKWIGNKQRFAAQIISFFPKIYNTYFEPFLGSGAVLARLSPKSAVASDSFTPLIEIFETLKTQPETLIAWYGERLEMVEALGKKEAYSRILDSFNRNHNGADFIFLTRACYGGVVRFRKADGYMSTPCGVHTPIGLDSFSERVWKWHARVQGTSFYSADFRDILQQARSGDLVYLDPPYLDTQTIVYGAQNFSLDALFTVIGQLKQKGVYVALSIDGKKKSGEKAIQLDYERNLFSREVLIENGRSMLRRFQMEGQTLESEVVHERLLLTY
jgi:DNA adenine methylase